MGSVLGTLGDVIDERREQGQAVGTLGITSYRPFPAEAIRAALGNAARVIVLERSLSLGSNGAVTTDVRGALAGTSTEVVSVVAGLGGRPVTKVSLHGLLDRSASGALETFSFLDLDQTAVDRELARYADVAPRQTQEVSP
jgi:pyruvate ferredoxin oxidoreductase alpha subunit